MHAVMYILVYIQLYCGEQDKKNNLSVFNTDDIFFFCLHITDLSLLESKAAVMTSRKSRVSTRNHAKVSPPLRPWKRS